MGRRRPHKPSMSQFDSGLRYQFHFHGLLDHSGGHLPRKQESGERSPGSPPISILQYNSGKVENPASLISLPSWCESTSRYPFHAAVVR